MPAAARCLSVSTRSSVCLARITARNLRSLHYHRRVRIRTNQRLHGGVRVANPQDLHCIPAVVATASTLPTLRMLRLLDELLCPAALLRYQGEESREALQLTCRGSSARSSAAAKLLVLPPCEMNVPPTPVSLASVATNDTTRPKAVKCVRLSLPCALLAASNSFASVLIAPPSAGSSRSAAYR